MTTASQPPVDPTELNALLALAARTSGRTAGRSRGGLSTDYRPAPDAAEVHYNLGILLCQQEQFDEALPWFEQALALKPNLVDAHHSLGRLFDRARGFPAGGEPLRVRAGAAARGPDLQPAGLDSRAARQARPG